MLGFNGSISRKSGVSLVETMIAVSIISVAFLAVINSFGLISKSIQVSKTKTLATNLCQEKLQILRQLSYLRLMVTPYPSYRTDFTPNIPYDSTYYTPETIIEGGIEFTRLTYVQMATEVGNDLVFLGSSPDTGIKSITCTVIWEREDKPYMLQLRTIYSNPNTIRTNAEFAGIVKTTSSVPISGASVFVAENMAWQDISTSTGGYSISCYDGVYTLVASKRGFFSKSYFKSAPPYTTVLQDFSLVMMSSGTVTGNVWLKDHMLISNVVASSYTVDGLEQEFVELYNPTTSYIRMVTGMAASPYELVYQQYDEDEQVIMLQYKVMDSSIPPNGFFLIANTDTINIFNTNMEADAVYAGANYGNNVISTPFAGGVGIRNLDGTWIDRLGWTRNPGVAQIPDIHEGTAISQIQGVVENQQYVRMSNAGSLSSGQGRSFDTDNNTYNFFNFLNMIYPPYNKNTIGIAIAGTPAVGAIVSCDDGLSLPTYAKAMGYPYTRAEFRLTEVATGTWRVMVSSYVQNSFGTGPLSVEISSVTISSNGQVLSIPNNLTRPTWPSAGYYSAFLTSQPAGGYVGGTVTNALGAFISPEIVVTARGVNSTASSITGRYMLPVGTGTMNVIANPTGDPLYNPNYITVTEENVNVDFGQITSTINFVLPQGGRVSGNVTRDGINPLPNVSITACNSAGAARGDTVSASNGQFTIINLATGTYTISPVLDSGERSVPSSFNALVTAGANVNVGTFTIVGAFGSITGSVTSGGKPISTGVLIVASTGSFTAPPSLSSATVPGCPYYFANSYENGTYVLEVRGSTTTAYNMQAYYPAVNNNLTTTIYNASKNNIWVTPGAATTGQNFTTW